jgi:hypothetical protein
MVGAAPPAPILIYFLPSFGGGTAINTEVAYLGHFWMGAERKETRARRVGERVSQSSEAPGSVWVPPERTSSLLIPARA